MVLVSAKSFFLGKREDKTTDKKMGNESIFVEMLQLTVDYFQTRYSNIY